MQRLVLILKERLVSHFWVFVKLQIFLNFFTQLLDIFLREILRVHPGIVSNDSVCSLLVQHVSGVFDFVLHRNRSGLKKIEYGCLVSYARVIVNLLLQLLCAFIDGNLVFLKFGSVLCFSYSELQ